MGCRYEGTGIWAGRCKGTREVDPCPGYDKCKQYKPDYPTKADRIRAMSDEELADSWMKDVVVCHRCAYVDECECDEYVAIEKCKEGLLEWLKQPAEERCGDGR